MSIAIDLVAKKLNINNQQVITVLNLLNEGSTVPFIARYRQGQTGGLNEEIIQEIAKLFDYETELIERKEYVISVLKDKGLLNPEIENKINQAQTKAEVENIYEPFKVGKKTKASEAIALGLEPLALAIMNSTDEKFNPYHEADKYVDGDKIINREFAITQAQFIIAQIISQDITTRQYVKDYIYNRGFIVTKIKKNAEDEKEVFAQYYDFQERVNRIPNHRVLAISRGEDKKILSYSFTYETKTILYNLNNKYFKIPRTGKIIQASLIDALDRLIYPSIEREIKADLFARAEKEAIILFGESLENMLLWPAVRDKWILAIDPAYVNGCKVAILDPRGSFKEKDIIFPNAPLNKKAEAAGILAKLCDKYPIDIIVIGNGTASRETEEFIAKFLELRRKINKNINTQYAIVSEIGASVYSASKIAIEEFPSLSVEERSAINIGRRFQDPLNELIKIDPKAIGVGQYQHDVDQKELSKNLEFKVNKVVNMVGVDLNSATKTILTFISGLSNKLAGNIIAYREEQGKFSDRNQLKQVKGLGAKAFEQSVGFLRIHDSKIFFDRTSIHPESYQLAYELVKLIDLDLENIDKELLKKQDVKHLAKELNSNTYDIQLIIDSLLNPTKDIRDGKDGYILKKDILKIEDLKPEMILEGSVLNITDFGAFIYIGLKEAALVHISNMKKDKNHFIKHPSEVLKVGDNVKIQIIDIDLKRSRIQAKLIY